MRHLLFIPVILILFACSGQKVILDEDLTERFERGMDLYEKSKWTKAGDEFEFVIMNNPGSQVAISSEFYLAECLFNQKKYPEAAVEFERYIRYSHDLDKIELSRYRVCQCALESSHGYQKDQTGTMTALSRLQIFIEDYPNSQHLEDAEASIDRIRASMAEKVYQTARLYLKLEEYESALIYFNDVLDRFYDTEFADESRIGIVFTYILWKNRSEAETYLADQEIQFRDDKKFQEAQDLLENTSDGKLHLPEYIRLIK